MTMRSPFKSKYYYAIIDKIAELENQAAEIQLEKARTKQTIRPELYCSLVCRIAEIESKIKVLRALL